MASDYHLIVDKKALCLTLVSLQAQSCLLRSRIQRVNGSLGSVMAEPNAISRSNPCLLEAVADSDLRWHNSVLTQVMVRVNTDYNYRVVHVIVVMSSVLLLLLCMTFGLVFLSLTGGEQQKPSDLHVRVGERCSA